MDEQFYEVQAESFSDYANKYPERDLITLFDEWTESKEIYGLAKEEIWRLVRKIGPKKERIIKEGEEEFVRLWAVLDMLIDNDFAQVSKLIDERKEKVIDKT